MQPLDTSIITLHVLLNDLDLNWHMNNGRFLTIMDLGRMDLLKRTGTLDLAIKNKWMPIVGTATIDFQRPLKLWQKYELHSHIYGWDEKWIYLEQTFYSNEKVIAIGKIKGLLRGKDGNIPPQDIMEKLQAGITSPVM
ncbi:MAG: thioesterase family protein [Gammaproteobacteria bacterium]|nr:thioesterase family protein [Gammaproteobacteria bacterium]